MKQYRDCYFFVTTALTFAMLMSACSNDEQAENDIVPSTDGMYKYTLHLNCHIADSTGEQTRATNAWEDGATIYLRFKDGSTFTAGTATYNRATDGWTLSVPSTLPTTSTETTCYAYHFKWGYTVYSTSINLTENTACYQGTGNYVHPNAGNSDIYVSVTLRPKNWRLRFLGRTNGTMTILGNSSDISYYTSFNRNTGEFSSTKKDISLNVSNGNYTQYVYGYFASPSSSNVISVRTNDSKEFYRNINGSTLQSKGSGWLYAPYINNYSGWYIRSKYVSNCDLRTSYPVAFTDRLLTEWTIGSNVALCFHKVYKASEISNLTDEQIVEKLKNEVTIIKTKESLEDFISLFYNLSSGTKHVLCTYCTDKNGDHGNLVKYEFTTLSTSAPQAEISNVRYNSSQWSCQIYKRNNAYSYYAYCGQGNSWYNFDSWLAAYYVRQFITTKQITQSHTYWAPDYTINFTKTSNYATICTWARNSYGTIGNCDVWQGYTNSRRQNKGKKYTTENNNDYYSVPKYLLPPINPDDIQLIMPSK